MKRNTSTVATRRAATWTLLGGLLVVIAGCSGEPFPMIKVSGTLTYEDGSLLPFQKGDTLGLVFLPQMPPRDPKTHPRTGTAPVNPEDGTFESVTSHKYGDGLVRGKYKVLIYITKNFSSVPPEYGDPDKTPLEIDSRNQPLAIKIRKPK